MDECDSSFETESDIFDTKQSGSKIQKRKNDQDDDQELFKKPKSIVPKLSKLTNTKTSSLMIDEYSKEEKHRRVNFHSLDQYTRHKLLINYYRLTYPGTRDQVFQRDHSKDKSDLQVLFENHRFIWPDDELQPEQLTWGQRVAKKYYDRLFKEYCIVDLSFFKENKFGMRWRTEPEVVEGKGQFICGGKRCSEKKGLTSWEVLFGYKEHGQKQSALVKLRLCPECSTKLNYHRQHKKAKKAERKARTSKSKNKIEELVFEVKEEIVSEDESGKTNKNNDDVQNQDQDKTYEELIDKIWRQPINLEEQVGDQQDDLDYREKQKQQLESDLDDYLNEFFF